MLVTLSGMIIEIKLVQSENVEFKMLVTLFGMVTEVKLMQKEKHPFANVCHTIRNGD